MPLTALSMMTATCTAGLSCAALSTAVSPTITRTTTNSTGRSRSRSGVTPWRMDSVAMSTAIRSSTAPIYSPPTSPLGPALDTTPTEHCPRTQITMGTGGWTTPLVVWKTGTGAYRGPGLTMPVTGMTGCGGAGSPPSTPVRTRAMGSTSGPSTPLSQGSTGTTSARSESDRSTSSRCNWSPTRGVRWLQATTCVLRRTRAGGRWSTTTIPPRRSRRTTLIGLSWYGT